ncbi:MAG: hypothetical protein JW913_08645 [Chitinispirillaceae bacterium]|nr:hypothetical protein [Chitinispirillaceae bacterium]
MNVSSGRLRNDDVLPSRPRSYPLPRRFVYLELIVISLISALVIFAWVPAILSIFRYGTVLASALRAAIFLNITAVSLLLFHLFVKNEQRRVQFILTDEFLAYKSALGVKKIRLDDIHSVSLIRFPVSCGVMEVKSGQGTINVPLILQNISDLTELMEEACGRVAGVRSVPQATWRRIHLLSAIADDAARRASAVFRPLLITSLAMLPAAVFIGAVYWDMSIIPLMLWSMAGLIVPLCVYATADIIIRVRGTQELDGQVPRHGSIDEKKVYAWSGFAFFLLYLIAGIVYKALVL